MQLKNYSTLILALLFSGLSLTAQTFYYEDFAGGALPDGWTSVDLTSPAGQECIFEYTALADSPVYTGEDAFMASSTLNGFLIANSDNVPAARPTNHTTVLTTSAIDCSGQTSVWLGFENHLGVYQVEGAANTTVRISTDGTTWTDFMPFPGFTELNSWTENPEIVTIDITDLAANQSTVFIQWEWIGNWEYVWTLDDITLSNNNVNPTPPNDMRINSFAAVAPNAMTPVSQVGPIGFIADIENVGSAEQTDIDLNVSITNSSGTEVFNSSINYDAIASDSLAENVFFTDEFTPPAVEDTYVMEYSLDYASTEDDANPENNTLASTFSVTGNTFAKEFGATRSIRPASNVDFTYGNVFYVNSATDADGYQLYADEISFAVSSGTPATVSGKSVNVFLYSWDGTTDNNDGNNITEDKYEFIGISSYTFDGSEGTSMISVPANDGDPIALEDDTYYIAAVQYFSEDGTTEFFLGASDAIDYAAMNFYSDSMAVLNNNPNRSRYGSVLDVGNEGTFGIVGFGFDLVPVVRLNIAPSIVSTEEVQLPNGSVSIFPNPAKDYTTVDIDLTDITSGTVQVLDMQGRIVQSIALNNVQQHRMNLVTKDLPSGQYSLRVQTELGVSTQKLVVQH